MLIAIHVIDATYCRPDLDLAFHERLKVKKRVSVFFSGYIIPDSNKVETYWDVRNGDNMRHFSDRVSSPKLREGNSYWLDCIIRDTAWEEETPLLVSAERRHQIARHSSHLHFIDLSLVSLHTNNLHPLRGIHYSLAVKCMNKDGHQCGDGTSGEECFNFKQPIKWLLEDKCKTLVSSPLWWNPSLMLRTKEGLVVISCVSMVEVIGVASFVCA